MLLDPHDWSLASRIDDVLPALSRYVADHAAAETHGSALELASGPHATPLAAAAGAGRAARRAGGRPRPARAARGGRGHPPVRAVERRRGLAGRALPVDLRLDARAGAARADVRAARPRRGARTPRRPCARCAGCACTCRCCSRSRRTRRSGRAATPGSPPRASRSSARSRASASRGAFDELRASTSRRSTCCCAARRSPSRRSCGGTCGCSPGSARSRCASWTRRRARPTTPRWPRSSSASCGWRRPRATPTTAIARRPEVLDENRFLATRDGMRAEFIDPGVRGRAGPRGRSSTSCSPRARPHAAELGCEAELAAVRGARRRARRPPPAHARRRRARATRSGPALGMLVSALANDFTAGLAQPAALA